MHSEKFVEHPYQLDLFDHFYAQLDLEGMETEPKNISNEFSHPLFPQKISSEIFINSSQKKRLH